MGGRRHFKAYEPKGLRLSTNLAFASGHSTEAANGVNSHWCTHFDRRRALDPLNWRWRHRAGIPRIGRERLLPVAVYPRQTSRTPQGIRLGVTGLQ